MKQVKINIGDTLNIGGAPSPPGVLAPMIWYVHMYKLSISINKMLDYIYNQSYHLFAYFLEFAFLCHFYWLFFSNANHIYIFFIEVRQYYQECYCMLIKMILTQQERHFFFKMISKDIFLSLLAIYSIQKLPFSGGIVCTISIMMFINMRKTINE